MPPSPAYRPDPQFEKLGPDFADPVAPAVFPELTLRWRNQAAAARVGLDTLTDAEWQSAFGRFEPLPENMRQPLAMRYHGHQFRVYNPDIGDGRGFLFAQLRDSDGRLLDLATKGSGQTPYSRFGDGRLTLKGGVREVLAAEMLWAQGVKTSKAFSLFETGEALERNDEPSPTRAAVLVRLQHAHVRFGTFQRHAAYEDKDALAKLVDHAGEAYFPEILKENSTGARAAALFRETCAASATLAAGWMSAGFVHGVLNTDNLVLTGESFDYGPWRFLPVNDPGFTAAYFDREGLYAFGRQPEAVHWNLAQLGGCLAQITDIAPLQETMNTFPPLYQDALVDAMFTRLGLARGGEDDLTFLTRLFNWMNESAVPWDQFFHDWVCGPASAARAKESPVAALYEQQAFAPVRASMDERTPLRPERLAHAYFQSPTPASLVIDEVEALWAPIAERDDWGAFHAKLAHIHALKDALAIAVA